MSGGGCAILLVAIVLSTLLDGVALRIMWGWFIVPTFNVPALSLAVAIGIMLIVSLMTVARSAASEKDYDEQAIQSLVWVVMKPLTYLGIGWIIAALM